MCVVSARFHERLNARLAAHAHANLMRKRTCASDAHGVSFISNDYLNLSTHPAVVAALHEGAQQYGVGSGASPLVSGYTEAHEALEADIAAFTGYESVMLFPSGYLANLGVIAALTEKHDFIMGDHACHASLIDACLKTPAKFERYPVGDMNRLSARLNDNPADPLQGERFIVTEGVFSTDGRIPDFNALTGIRQAHDATLIVDDAHGFGVVGDHGQGTLADQHILPSQCDILIGTFGKACGTAGAFVASTADVIEALIQFARPYMFTIALSPAIACATRQSIALMRTTNLVERLQNRIQFFYATAQAEGLSLPTHTAAIIPIPIGDEATALQLVQRAQQEKLYLSALRTPTVKRHHAALRISLTAQHSDTDLLHLVAFLKTHAAHYVHEASHATVV